MDALQYGFRPVVRREDVGDRNPEANVYDTDAKYGNVVRVEDALGYLQRIVVGR